MNPLITWLRSRWGEKRAPDVVRAYQRRLDLTDPDAKLILRDLAAYCSAGVSAAAGTGNAHELAIAAGRQDAFAHIADMLGVDPLSIAVGNDFYRMEGTDDE